MNNVEFSGSIGQVYESNAGRDSPNNKYAVGSGVLVSSFASGSVNINGTTPSFLNISINNIILKGLKVTDCKESYAPLLINNIGSRNSTNYIYGYTTLNVDTVNVQGYDKNSTAVASSLIGNVGDSKAKSITMTFTHIILPDKKADGTDNGGIFSHATLLERFAYASDDNTSGATYNFLSSEDWNGNEHDHKVTYGYEITKTTNPVLKSGKHCEYFSSTNGINCYPTMSSITRWSISTACAKSFTACNYRSLRICLSGEVPGWYGCSETINK